MAIDKTQEYWHGENAEDAIEYLVEYSENNVTKAAIIKCRQCNSDILTYKIDSFEGAIEITCTSCKEARLLLDSEDYWEDSEPEEAICTNATAPNST